LQQELPQVRSQSRYDANDQDSRDGAQQRHVAPFRAGLIWDDLATGVSIRVNRVTS
jgi:hypothetical protein